MLIGLRNLAVVLGTVLMPGCYYLGQNTYSEIVSYPSATWSDPEKLTMIMEAGNNNLRDTRTNIKAIVTPYYPSVIKAIGRRYQAQAHWTEGQFQSYVNQLLRESSGLYVDWENPTEPVYNQSLKVLESPEQYDSLLFLLTLRNTGWPPGKYMLVPRNTQGGGMINEVVALDDPHYQAPDISRLDSNIYLVNEDGASLRPAIVWGRRMNYLTNIDETVFVKFKLAKREPHFLAGSTKFYFVIHGIESDIKLELSTVLMR